MTRVSSAEPLSGMKTTSMSPTYSIVAANLDGEEDIASCQPGGEPELLAVRRLARSVIGDAKQSSQFRVVSELGPPG